MKVLVLLGFVIVALVATLWRFVNEIGDALRDVFRRF